jgi:hypothetical protein
MPIVVNFKPIEITFILKDHIYEILQMNVYDEGTDPRLGKRSLAEKSAY